MEPMRLPKRDNYGFRRSIGQPCNEHQAVRIMPSTNVAEVTRMCGAHGMRLYARCRLALSGPAQGGTRVRPIARAPRRGSAGVSTFLEGLFLVDELPDQPCWENQHISINIKIDLIAERVGVDAGLAPADSAGASTSVDPEPGDIMPKGPAPKREDPSRSIWKARSGSPPATEKARPHRAPNEERHDQAVKLEGSRLRAVPKGDIGRSSDTERAQLREAEKPNPQSDLMNKMRRGSISERTRIMALGLLKPPSYVPSLSITPGDDPAGDALTKAQKVVGKAKPKPWTIQGPRVNTKKKNIRYSLYRSAMAYIDWKYAVMRHLAVGKSWLRVYETPLEVKIEQLAREFRTRHFEVAGQFLGTLFAIGAMAPDQDPKEVVTVTQCSTALSERGLIRYLDVKEKASEMARWLMSAEALVLHHFLCEIVEAQIQQSARKRCQLGIHE